MRAQSELRNNGVGIGDLFLFFGWFKKKDNPKINIHKIFGWLQIEEILEGDNQISNFLKKYNLSHPHDPKYRQYKNNTIYVSRKNFGQNFFLIHRLYCFYIVYILDRVDVKDYIFLKNLKSDCHLPRSLQFVTIQKFYGY